MTVGRLTVKNIYEFNLVHMYVCVRVCVCACVCICSEIFELKSTGIGLFSYDDPRPDKKSIDSFRDVLQRFCATKRYNGHAVAVIRHSIGLSKKCRLRQYTDGSIDIEYIQEPRMLIGGVNKAV